MVHPYVVYMRVNVLHQVMDGYIDGNKKDKKQKTKNNLIQELLKSPWETHKSHILSLSQVWPGETVFPDYTSQACIDWWVDEYERFSREIKHDALWIVSRSSDTYNEGVRSPISRTLTEKPRSWHHSAGNYTRAGPVYCLLTTWTPRPIKTAKRRLKFLSHR